MAKVNTEIMFPCHLEPPAAVTINGELIKFRTSVGIILIELEDLNTTILVLPGGKLST